MSVIRWEEPPGGREKARSSFDSHAIAAALRRRPRCWAVVAENPASGGLSTQIERAHFAAFNPAGSYEAVRRNVAGVNTVYARYVGGGS